MKSEDLEQYNESMEEGVLQILGKNPLPAPEKSPPPCMHESDGYVYEETPRYLLLMCTRCKCQYEEMK